MRVSDDAIRNEIPTRRAGFIQPTPDGASWAFVPLFLQLRDVDRLDDRKVPVAPPVNSSDSVLAGT
jgi:hypothetical protein